jgi:UDP-N-acetylglucosamine--N-acetylmuramyl-(pentapeptide) pyrophosphoryl-undecaprenol N-acetylglucosamine transferase
MKVLLTGGGSGGHFFPLIAVARALREAAERERLVTMQLTLMSDEAFDMDVLRAEELRFVRVAAGKLRRYASLLNVTDMFKTAWGLFRALWYFFLAMPDVVFAKGGYTSLPALFAARVFHVPVLIHESDAVAGKVNRWASAFAKRVAVAFPEAAAYFPEGKVAYTGNPIRKDVLGGNLSEAQEVYGLEAGLPVLLVLGGSQGARALGEVVIDALPELVSHCVVVHQTGPALFQDMRRRASVVLAQHPQRGRYHAFPFLDAAHLRNASRAATIVLSRAGSVIFEIAAWNVPAILVPLPHAAQDHQRANAYAYARAGGAAVIEEENLAPHLLVSEVRKLLTDASRQAQMRKAAQRFARVDAADKVAEEIIRLGIHE